MKKLLLIFVTITTVGAHAQVSLTQSHMPKPGTTYYMYDANTPSPPFNFSISGTGNMWDFTGVYAYPGADDTIFWTIPSQSPGGASFPTADVATHEGTDKTVSFLKADQNAGYLLGIGGDVLGNGSTMSAPLDVPVKGFSFPYTLNTKLNGAGTMNIKVPGSAMGQSGIDSLWFKHTEGGSKEVIAEGTIKVPAGSYPAILEIVRKNGIDSLFMKSAATSGQWVLAPNFPKTDHDSTYYWYSDQSLQHYAHVIYKGGQVTDVHYFKSVTKPNGIREANTEGIFDLYPNPSNGKFNMVYRSSIVQKENVYVYNILGEQVYKDTWNNETQKTIDLQGLTQGVYFLKLGQETKKIVIR